jgi:hypothetical protein
MIGANTESTWRSKKLKPLATKSVSTTNHRKCGIFVIACRSETTSGGAMRRHSSPTFAVEGGRSMGEELLPLTYL